MKLTGLMLCRNEDWVLGLSLRVALLWCDSVVVLLHCCVDRSREIVEEVIRENKRGRVIVLHDSNPVWEEMQHRQAMLESARRHGAEHIAIIDADEVLSGNLILRNGFGQGLYFTRNYLQPGQMLQLPLYYLRGSLTRYHANGIWGNRIVDVAFRDDPRAHWGGDTFHARAPRGITWQPYLPVEQHEGGIMHLWGCSERRLKAKAAMYKITERLRWPEKPVQIIDRMYSWCIHGQPGHPSYGTPETWSYREMPAEWWQPYSGLMKHLDIDAEPWQVAEVQRLVAKHPGIAEGLDLFGIFETYA